MFDDDQYMEIDRRILERLERQRSVLASIRKTKYRQILLGLSDQLLVTSVGILVAIYVQICTMSLLCFNVGAELAFLASGVHMNCLVVLGSYFEEHRRQARVRIYLMVFLLAFILVTNFLVYITWYNSGQQTIVCAIRHYETDWPFLFVAWLALCWWVSAGFRKSINQLRDARSEFPRVHSLVHSLMGLIYNNEESRTDLEAWNERETQRIRSKYRQQCRILRQRSPKPPWRITAPIIASAIVDDFWQSIIFITMWNLSYTVTGMYFLVKILVAAGIYYKPLLEPKFGQVLPLIMLLVLLFNIMEASEASELTLLLPGRITRQNTTEWVAPPRRRATGFEGHRQTGVEAIMSGGLSRRQTGDTVREQRPPVDRQPAPIPEEPEANGIQPPNRANTLLMETGYAGETEHDKNLDNRFDLSAIVYEDTPRWVIKLAFFMAFTMTVLFFYLLVQYFNEMVIAMCALDLLYQFGHICKGFWGFWKTRRERRRSQPI
ncbi:hypothetical protein ColTof4_01737 [Colletotrichum tofieldiae]|nr:hypothetical protein ColTof3_09980 [Colletotrichum tofieldiae]GKT69314.1 hypothetical protein ColTof4_01737 [Colletotrichum tofieldiae]